jgi:hypothetical protein
VKVYLGVREHKRVDTPGLHRTKRLVCHCKKRHKTLPNVFGRLVSINISKLNDIAKKQKYFQSIDEPYIRLAKPQIWFEIRIKGTATNNVALMYEYRRQLTARMCTVVSEVLAWGAIQSTDRKVAGMYNTFRGISKCIIKIRKSGKINKEQKKQVF